MRLNPPTVIIFLISLLLACLAFWLAITAYFVLMVGNVVKGL